MNFIRLALMLSLFLGCATAGAEPALEPLTPPVTAEKSECKELVKDVSQQGGWYRQPLSDTVIVFVHGIWSDSRSAWLTTNAPCAYWPQLVATDSDAIGSAAVFLGGYYSKADSAKATVTDVAAQLYTQMAVPSGTPAIAPIAHRRIVFVAHSLGGVVVRKMLVDNANEFQDRDVSLVLYASPTRGSDYADILQWIQDYYPIELLAELRTDSPTLEKLNDDFRGFMTAREREGMRVHVAEFFESRFPQVNCPLGRVISILCSVATGRMTEIVQKERAGNFDYTPVRIPDADHLTIVKPHATTDDSHSRLKLALQTMSVIPVKSAFSPQLGKVMVAGTVRKGLWETEGQQNQLVTYIGLDLCKLSMKSSSIICNANYQIEPYGNPPKEGDRGFVVVDAAAVRLTGTARVEQEFYPRAPTEKLLAGQPVYSSVTNVLSSALLADATGIYSVKYQPVRFRVTKEDWKQSSEIPMRAVMNIRIPKNVENAELLVTEIGGVFKKKIADFTLNMKLGMLQLQEVAVDGGDAIYRFEVNPRVGRMK